MRKVRTLTSEEVTKFKERFAKRIDIKEITPTTCWSPLRPRSSRITLRTCDVPYEVSDGSGSISLEHEIDAWIRESETIALEIETEQVAQDGVHEENIKSIKSELFNVECVVCGNKNSSSMRFCKHCGVTLGMMKCSRCGKHNEAGCLFCEVCGTSILLSAKA